MYFNRNSTPAFTKLQYELRALKLEFYNCYKLGLPSIIVKIDEIINITKQLISSTAATYDESYFQFLQQTFIVIKFQTAYLQALQSGGITSAALKNAVEFNLEQLQDMVAKLDLSRPSVKALFDFASTISNTVKISAFFLQIDHLAHIQLPFVYGVETNPYADFRRHMETNGEAKEKETVPLLLSVRFLTDNELWANPQVLRPGIQYSISGVIKLNYIPEGYNKLVIRHVSTTSDDFFILSLPEITLSANLEFTVNGQIVFKYPQSTFDPPIVVRLVAQLLGLSAPPLYPHLIGYDELITKVIDENVFKYPTGYKKLNQKAMDIGLELQKELPQIDRDELDHFLVLLSVILNYSGYCANYGIYKKTDKLFEDEFRDRLIAYISTNPALTSDVVKEAHLAGGRVEIRYKNIIAELKVEKSISDRTKMVKQYKRQPSVYASAISAELSILCILDLTPKTLPPAPAAKNVFTIPASFHGYENAPTTSKVAVIIIDGNLKNPSDY